MFQVAYHPIYIHPLPEGHRFPMIKYELIPAQLKYEGTLKEDNFFSPVVCKDEIIEWTHHPAYLQKLHELALSAKEQREIGFPQSTQLVQRELIITQGTIDCCLHALNNEISLNIAGGTHHAFADHGEGFCLLNDFAVAANYLIRKNLADKILIIDLDVHQGNGTASLFKNVDRVFTFSMHGEHNYPFRKESSDLDIPLKDGTGDQEFLDILSSVLPSLIQTQKPSFAFYLSGVDILSTDRFGKLKVSADGCKKRDEYVFTQLRNNHIPCTVAMGGGYSTDVRQIVEGHCNTFRVAKNIYG